MPIDATITDTPDALVSNGRIESGFFTRPFRRVRLLDAANMGGRAGRWLRRLRLKQWVGFGFSHPELYGAMIIQNAAYAASGTVYLYDKREKTYHEWLIIDPRAALPENLYRGESRCGGGKRRMRFFHELDEGRHRVEVRIPASRKHPECHVNLVLHQDMNRSDPLVVSLPIGHDHHTYTHKSPMRMEGEIRVGDTLYSFDPARDIANLDEQKTFYPYRSAWRWGTFAAITGEGREVVLNVVDQMTPKDEPGEDALWIDGRLELLPQPEIVDLPEPGITRVEDRAGRMRLTFTRVGAKAEKRNYGLIFMDYAQRFGTWNGEITDKDGHTHTIKDAWGALERMRARF